jgi:hypothetical protein
VHVVTHGSQPVLRGFRSRAPDFVAALLGLGVALIGDEVASRAPLSPAPVHRGLGPSLLELSLDTLPLLLAGLIAGTVLHALFARAVARLRLPRNLVLAGLCCAAPELGLSTVLVGARFLGWRFAIIRLFGTWLVAGAALATAQLSQGARGGPERREGWGAPRFEPSPPSLLLGVDRALLRTGAFVALGLVAAAFAEVSLPPASLVLSPRSAVPLLFVVALALPSSLCAPAAVVLGAVLVAKGLSPDVVLAGLLIGPAIRATAFMAKRETHGLRSAIAAAAVVLGAGACVTVAFNRWFASVDLHAHEALSLHSYGAATYAAAAAIALLALCGIWRVGASQWLSVLWDRHRTPLDVHDELGESVRG